MLMEMLSYYARILATANWQSLISVSLATGNGVYLAWWTALPFFLLLTFSCVFYLTNSYLYLDVSEDTEGTSQGADVQSNNDIQGINRKDNSNDLSPPRPKGKSNSRYKLVT